MFSRHLMMGLLRSPHDTAGMAGEVNTRGRGNVDDAMSRGARAAATTDTDTDDTGDGDDGEDAGDDDGADETTDRDDSADKPSLQQAFERSLRQHSKPAPKGKGTEQAADADASTADEGTERGTTRRGTASTRAAATETDQEGLITDDEYAALQEKHKDDPKALRRALEGAFTKKTQALAAERTSLERLTPYRELVDALESDDKNEQAEAIRFLAKEYGVDLAPAKGATETERADQADEAAAQLLDQFKADLGPELEYLADGLMPALSKMVERLTASTVSKELAPVKAREKVLTEKEAVRENDALFAEFSKAVPDWKEHEEKMFELSQRMQPGKGMEPLEYLKALHRLATSDLTEDEIEKRAEAKATAKLAKRTNKTNRAAAAVEERVDDVADRHVSKRGPATPTLQESWDAAKRGERFED